MIKFHETFHFFFKFKKPFLRFIELSYGLYQTICDFYDSHCIFENMTCIFKKMITFSLTIQFDLAKNSHLLWPENNLDGTTVKR